MFCVNYRFLAIGLNVTAIKMIWCLREEDLFDYLNHT